MGSLKFASIIVTYRCNARCRMCNTWLHPSRREQEIGTQVYEKLPFVNVINITGGEPFLREDLGEIVAVLRKKSRRLVISSNGYLTGRILDFFRDNRDVGIRVSIEGLPRANDELRGLKDGFDLGLRTLLNLHHMGVRDIGFGITVSDGNAGDMVELYRLSEMMGLEFATAAVHNAFYFHKFDNRFVDPDAAVAEFRKLIAEMLKSRRIKNWFRAYFNLGLIGYIKGRPRLLPCEMGNDSFFLDPFGEVLACNVLEDGMGSLKEDSFADIWNGPRARSVRNKVKDCKKNCWMVGSVSQQMRKKLWKPASWILAHKILGRETCA